MTDKGKLTGNLKDLRQYVAEQITDYVHSVTNGSKVENVQMESIASGIRNICIAAYPEHEGIISSSLVKLTRAALNAEQLSFPHKMQRVVDRVVESAFVKNDVVKDILKEITSTKRSDVNHSNIAKDSLASTTTLPRKNIEYQSR